MREKRNNRYQVRFTDTERETIDKAVSLSESKTLVSRIVQEGALKEAKKIIKEIENAK